MPGGSVTAGTIAERVLPYGMRMPGQATLRNSVGSNESSGPTRWPGNELAGAIMEHEFHEATGAHHRSIDRCLFPAS